MRACVVTSFELVDNPLSEDPDAYPDCCNCKHSGNQMPVLLSVEDGSISVVCAICRRSFAFLDDWASVSSDEIPMTLAYHDTTVHYPEPEYDGYWQLTLRADGAS